MEKKNLPNPEAGSAMGPIAHALIQDYLGPDHKVTDMERFFTALMQALHDAYTLEPEHKSAICRLLNQRPQRLALVQSGF